MNGPARRDRPGINARAMQSKSAEGTEQASGGKRMVDAERESFGVLGCFSANRRRRGSPVAESTQPLQRTSIA
jgi:hypothetical protein